MEKSRLKVYIAREGLIIIFLLLLGGISFFLRSVQTNTLEFQMIEPYLKSNEASLKGYQTINTQGIILSFPRGTNDLVIKETLNRDFPEVRFHSWIILNSSGLENKIVNAVYDEKGNRLTDNETDSIFNKINFSYVTIFFLFICYPSYLILRFVIWAIITLRVQG